MDLVSRFELIGDEYLHAAPECRQVMSRFGWLEFLRKFFGFNMAVSKAFAESFDGVNAHVGDIELRVTEEFISQAIGLPQTGERWYKGKHIKNDHWKGFLTPAHRQTKFKSGFPSRLLMNKWLALLELIIGYVTCEGRLSQMQFYHLQVLMIFKGYPVNMRYFFLNSLQISN